MRPLDRLFMLQLCSHQVNALSGEFSLLSTLVILLLLDFVMGFGKYIYRCRSPCSELARASKSILGQTIPFITREAHTLSDLETLSLSR